LGVEKPTAEEADRIKKAEAAAVADPNNEAKLDDLRNALHWFSNRNGGVLDNESLLVCHQAIIDSLSKLKPTEAKAVRYVDYAVNHCRVTIANYRAPLSDLEKALDVNPDDYNAMGAFSDRSRKLIEELAQSDPAKATAVMEALKVRVAKVTENCSTDSMKRYMEGHASFMPGIERRFIAARKQGLLVGKEAPELQVENWIQGDAIKLADLKGKVVLVDFWAVWCPPCIESFPKLQEWRKKYSDKGLVIIGVSRSCNFTFDELTGKTTLNEGDDSPPDEPELLRKFARFHKIDYPLAIEKQGSHQNDVYGRASIPQVVLIGKDGKVRLVRTGTRDETIKEIETALETLVRE
jgi:thiol-disulfide isomerase/thioredoxin